MTTSMDGIEEIANEPKEDEQPKENGVEKVEEENTEQDVAEIPVSILDGGNEEKPQEEKEQKVEAEEEQAEAPEEEQKIEEAPQEEEAAVDPPKEEESVAEKEFELQVK